MKSASKLTEGAILLAAFTVLLLITIYIPLIGVFLNLLLPIPFILFAAKNDWKAILIFVLASLILSFITGAILSFPLIIAYSLTGAMMGWLIQKNISRSMILILCSLVFLVNLVFLYAISIAIFHFNFIDSLIKTMQDSLSQSSALLKSLGQPEQTKQAVKTFEQALNLVKTLIPSLFVLMSISYVFIIQLVSLPILKRFGINVGNWKPFRDISLPKSLLWYYLAVMLASMFLHPQTGSYWSMALMNLAYILQMFMVFQGLTFVFYYLHKRNAAKPLPVIAVIIIFVFPYILYIVGILGIIDLGFGLRKSPKNIE